MTARTRYLGMFIDAMDFAEQYLGAAGRKGLGLLGQALGNMHGSRVIFGSSETVNYSLLAPLGVAFSTSTLNIYKYDGVEWSSAPISNQYVFLDTTTNIITATGTVTRSGIYGLFFQATDSSAPITTFSIQGSSSAWFNVSLISTNSYVVLTSTDIAVSGFAAGVATTYYRVDPTSASSAYSIYVSSIPLPLGFHMLEYRSVDNLGNTETVKRSTFLVTASTVFEASGEWKPWPEPKIHSCFSYRALMASPNST
jgi:hypothetical protein